MDEQQSSLDQTAPHPGFPGHEPAPLVANGGDTDATGGPGTSAPAAHGGTGSGGGFVSNALAPADSTGPQVPDHVPAWMVADAQIPLASPMPTPGGEAWLQLHLEALVTLMVRAGAGRQALDVLSDLYMTTRQSGPDPDATRL